MPKVNKKPNFPRVIQPVRQHIDFPVVKPVAAPTTSRSIQIWQKNGGDVGAAKKNAQSLIHSEMAKPINAAEFLAHPITPKVLPKPRVQMQPQTRQARAPNPHTQKPYLLNF
jgi:hypothetical protein